MKKARQHSVQEMILFKINRKALLYYLFTVGLFFLHNYIFCLIINNSISSSENTKIIETPKFLLFQIIILVSVFIVFSGLKYKVIPKILLRSSPLGGFVTTFISIFIGIGFITGMFSFPFISGWIFAEKFTIYQDLNIQELILTEDFLRNHFTIFISFYLIYLLLITLITVLPALLISKISTIYHKTHVDNEGSNRNPFEKFIYIYCFTFIKARIVESPYNTTIASLLFFISSTVSTIATILNSFTQVQPSLIIFQLGSFSLIISEYIRSFIKLYNTYEEHSFYMLREKIIFKERFEIIVVGYSNLGKQIIANQLNAFVSKSVNYKKKFKLIIDNDFEIRLIPKQLLIIEKDCNKFDELYKDKVNSVLVGIFKGEEINYCNPKHRSNNDAFFNDISICGINSAAQNISIWKYLNFSKNPVIIITEKNIDIIVSLKRFFSVNLRSLRPLIINYSNSLNQKLLFNYLRGSSIFTIDDSDFEAAGLACTFYKMLRTGTKNEQDVGYVNSKLIMVDSFHFYQKISNKLAQYYPDIPNRWPFDLIETDYNRTEKKFLKFIHYKTNIEFNINAHNAISRSENIQYFNSIAEALDSIIRDNRSKIYIVACVRPFVTLLENLGDLYLQDVKNLMNRLVFILSGTSIYHEELNSLFPVYNDEDEIRLKIIKRYFITSNLIISLIDSWRDQENGKVKKILYNMKVCVDNQPITMLKLLTELQGIKILEEEFIQGYYPSFYTSYSFPAGHLTDIENTFFFNGEFFLDEIAKNHFSTTMKLLNLSLKNFQTPGEALNNPLDVFGSRDLFDYHHNEKSNMRFERTLWHEPDLSNSNDHIGSDYGNLKIICKGNKQNGTYISLLNVIYGNRLRFSSKSGKCLGYNIGYDYGTTCSHKNHYIQEFFLERNMNCESNNSQINDGVDSIVALHVEFYNRSSNSNNYINILKNVFEGYNIDENQMSLTILNKNYEGQRDLLLRCFDNMYII